MLKGMIILALILVAGCAPYVSLEQLENEALATGDWSKVEQRQRIIARQDLRRSGSCPAGTTEHCAVEIGQQRCTCVDEEFMSVYLEH